MNTRARHGFGEQMLRPYIFAILDLIYPVKCVVCGDFQDRYLCEDCLDKIEPVGSDVCDTCGAPYLDRICSQCQEMSPSFELARAVGRYEGVLRDAIHELKYNGKLPVARELAELMIAFAASHPRLTKDVDVVIPMPIHYIRERRRGFNQADLLARPLAEALGLPVLRGVLVRTRAGKPQVELEADQRRENVRGVFGVAQPAPIRDRTVLLVDDVLTTGSTADEAARTLKIAGVRAVRVFTLARSC